VRVLSEPKKFGPLRQFSCGRGRSESSVNQWAKKLARGAERDQTVVVLEDADRRLVGIGSFKLQPVVAVDVSVGGDAQRIHVVAIDRLYRGKRLRDGSRPGDALLGGMLEQIRVACGGRMPAVSALVSPENGPSHALFDRHGFRRMPYTGEGEVIRVRLPDKRLSLVRLRLMRETS
jgi:ribosomal protein S18 acetylase RimI-like enzyme